MTNTASEVKHPVRDPKTPSTKNDLFAPSAVWGDKPIWDSQTLMHNPMMDEKGRVWFTARIRPSANPAFCKAGSNHPSAKAFPLNDIGPPALLLRSQDRQVHADRHLLLHAPPELRA